MSENKVVHGQHGHEAHLVEHAQDEIPNFQVNGEAYEYCISGFGFSIESFYQICYFDDGAAQMERYFASVCRRNLRMQNFWFSFKEFSSKFSYRMI